MIIENKSFSVSFKDAFVAAALLWSTSSFFFLLIIISRFVFDFPKLSGVTTDNQIIVCSVIFPITFASLIFFIYTKNIRFKVEISDGSIRVIKNDEVNEIRQLIEVKSISRMAGGSRIKIEFETQPELVVSHLSPWKMNELITFLTQITSRAPGAVPNNRH